MKWIRHHPRLIILAALIVVPALILIYLDIPALFFPLPQDFDQAVIRQMSASKLPGAAFLAIRDGKVIYSKGYGFADLQTGRRVTPDTLFTIASISKTVTATALMTLYDDGLFQLDDDVNGYLPFEVRNPHYPDQPITFRKLLAHTSSLKDSDDYNSFYTLYQPVGMEDSPIPLGEFVQDYFGEGGKYYDAKANFSEDAPGEKYLYSNFAYALLGDLVERISDQLFDSYCREVIFEPLGMTHTTWMFRDVDHNLMAVPYSYQDLQRNYKRVGFYGYPDYPSGSIKTSANEFVRFLNVFLNEGKTQDGMQLLKPKTAREMLRIQYPEAGTPVGLAWHESNGIWMHTGGDIGMSTLAIIDPEKHLALLMFANGDGGDALLLGPLRTGAWILRLVPYLNSWFAD